jgi:hypothetical protein
MACKSRVLLGKIRLYFGEQSGAYEGWGDIVDLSRGTCRVFNDGDMDKIWQHMALLRTKWDDLVAELQKALDDFVLQELELPSQD